MNASTKRPVRFSALKHMSRSPAHFLHAAESGFEETLAMRLGSGCHAILFAQPCIVFPGKVRNGKVWDAFEAEHAEKCILNAREYDQAQAMADAILCHFDARRLLFADDVVHESTIHWQQLGRDCSGTPDVRGGKYIVDLKTTRCAEPGRFVRDGGFRHYPAQLAWYMDGVIASHLGTPSEAYIVAVESTPPHPVTVLRLTDRALMQGRKACRIWLERLLGCERDDRWPGYVESIVDFDADEPLELEVEGQRMTFAPGSLESAMKEAMGEDFPETW